MGGDVIYFDGVRYRFSGSYFQRSAAKHGERFLHRAVWVAANGPVPDGCVIHHRDENTRNNDLSNLECMTVSDHHKHHFSEMWTERATSITKYGDAVEKASKWTRTPEGRAFLSKLNATNRAAGKYDNLDRTAFYAGRDAWAKSKESAALNRAHMLRLHATGAISGPSATCLEKAAEWHSSDEGRQWHSDLATATWAKRVMATATCTVCGTGYETFTPTRSKYCSGRCKASALRARRKQDS